MTDNVDTLIIINIILSALSPIILGISMCLKRVRKSKCCNSEIDFDSEQDGKNNYPIQLPKSGNFIITTKESDSKPSKEDVK